MEKSNKLLYCCQNFLSRGFRFAPPFCVTYIVEGIFSEQINDSITGSQEVQMLCAAMKQARK